MAKKELKLAIMGATGVGKSVFLASYFKYATQDGEGALAVSIADQESIDYVSEMIQALFFEQKPITGTDKRYNMSFHVGQLDCSISLQDIPGGWTTSASSWEDAAVNISQDLKNADGVIFFVSVGDLLQSERYDEAMQAFSLALTLLRKPRDGSAPRQDVPVCVVFTKGDLSPETSLEALEAKYRAFLKNAQEGGEKFNWFKVGRNVKCWKSVAMGRWEQQDQPPIQGEHENVIEPVEWLIGRMVTAKSEHRKRWARLISVICAVFVLGIFLGDHARWYFAEKEIVRLTEIHNYDKAESALDKFEQRLFFGQLLPRFLRAGSNVADIRVSVLGQSAIYDKGRLKDMANKDFDSLSQYITGADWSQYPQAEPAYYADAVERMQAYLDKTDYYQVAPDEYDKVKQALPYWTVCKELRSVEADMDESANAETDPFARLEKLLKASAQIPDEWRERLNPKMHGLVLAWVSSLSGPDSPETATQFVNQGNMLIQHSNLPRDSAHVLNGKIAEWRQAEIQLWEPICNQWLSEAAGMDPGDAIAFLSDKKAKPNLPDQFRRTVDDTLQTHWQRRFDVWNQEASFYETPQEAFTFLSQQRSMAQLPENIREQLEEKLRHYEEKVIEAKVNEIKDKAISARDLEELAKDLLPVFDTLGNDCPKAVSKANSMLSSRIDELVQDKFSTSETQFGKDLLAEDFDSARETMEQGLRQIKSGLERFQGKSINVSRYDGRVEKHRANMMQRLEAGEFVASKKAFDQLKSERTPSNHQIDKVIKSLNHFMNTYPSSDKNSKIMQVKDFLEAVKNGIRGSITIVSSNCKGWLWGGNEFMVHVSTNSGEQWDSEVREDANINWNEHVSIKWNPTTTVNFQLEEQDDLTKNDVFLNRTVLATGIFGYKRLNKDVTLYGDKKNCSLHIKAEIDPPKLPREWE